MAATGVACLGRWGGGGWRETYVDWTRPSFGSAL